MKKNNKKKNNNLKKNNKKEDIVLKITFIIFSILYIIFSIGMVIVLFSLGYILGSRSVNGNIPGLVLYFMIFIIPILLPYLLYITKKPISDNRKMGIVITELIIMLIAIPFWYTAWSVATEEPKWVNACGPEYQEEYNEMNNESVDSCD